MCSVSSDLEIVSDLRDLAEHDRRRAVFLGRQMHRLFDALGVEPLAGDGEVDVDLREHLGVGVGAGGIEVGDAVGDLLAAFAQDHDDVEGGAAAQPQQQHFHRAHAEVLAAGLGGAVHDDAVAGFALADETDAFDEFDTGFHGVPSGKNCAEFVPQNAQPFVQGKAAVAQSAGGGQEVEDVVDVEAGKLDAGGDDVESLRFEQGDGTAQVPGMGDQHDALNASLFERRYGQPCVVPGGERGVFDPACGQAVFGVQDVLHDAAFGELAAAGFAAGGQDRQSAGAMQKGGVAQAFEADAVQGVAAAVFGRVHATAAAEDDDGVGVL